MDMDNLTVLNRLAEGRLRYTRALRLLKRNAIRRRLLAVESHGCSRPKWFRCLHIRIMTDGRRRIWLSVPLWLGDLGLVIAGCVPKVRRQLRQQGLSVLSLRRILRQLKLPDNLLAVEVASKDGATIEIRNASRQTMRLAEEKRKKEGIC